MFRNFKTVSHVLFGRGCFTQLDDILSKKRENRGSFVVFLVDDVFSESPLTGRIPLKDRDLCVFLLDTFFPKIANL